MWAHKAIAILALLVFLTTAKATHSTDTFHESLHLRPLPSGRVHSIFNFRLSSSRDTKARDFQLLPASFITLLENQPVPLQELHLSFNKGRWDYQTWGRPVIKDKHGVVWGSEMVGNGAEVWAKYTVPSDHLQQVHPHRPTARQADVFHSLLASLSGQFCSTLAATGSREGISMPSNMTRTLYGMRTHDTSSSLVMHLTQPPSPCTETLYPMLALLPCKAAVGLASLLEPHHWLATEWHGIELSVARQSAGGWVLNVVAASVYDPVRATGKRDFSMSDIFGRSLNSTCPLATDSFVRLVAPSDGTGLRVLPVPQHGQETKDTDVDADADTDTDATPHLLSAGELVYLSNLTTPLDVSLQWPHNETTNDLALSTTPSTLHIERSYTSTSQLNGHILVRMSNTRPDISRRLVYREVIPWFVDLNLPQSNTSTTSLGPPPPSSPSHDTSYIQFTSDLTSSPIIRLAYTPSIPRNSPATIEVEFNIPPRVQVEWKVPFDKETIRYEEHPPDAHRGLEVGVGTVWEVRNDDDDYDHKNRQLPPPTYSILSTYKLTPSLVEVTVPDFSMPYNVIIFTCTLLALFAGSTLNIITRRYKDVAVALSGADDKGHLIRDALRVWRESGAGREGGSRIVS